MRYPYIAIFLVFTLGVGSIKIPSLYAQTNPGTRQSSVSSSASAKYQDVFSTLLNPALYDTNSPSSAGIAYIPSPFGLNELTGFMAGYETSLYNLHTAVVISTFGFELYRETDAQISLAGDIHGISAGIGLMVKRVNISTYGSSAIFLLNVGFAYSPARDVTVAASLFNVGNQSYKNTDDQIGQTFALAGAYALSENSNIYLRIQKETGFTPAVNTGLEISLIPEVMLAGGADIANRIYTTGLSLMYLNARINYGVVIHPLLGISHSIGAGFAFN